MQTLLERLHTRMDSKPYGERLMLIRYRMHGEQIANIAQTMREFLSCTAGLFKRKQQSKNRQ